MINQKGERKRKRDRNKCEIIMHDWSPFCLHHENSKSYPGNTNSVSHFYIVEVGGVLIL